MAGRIEAKLKELGIELPTPPAPVASYVPYVRTGNLVFVSGQVTLGPKGLEYVGIVGKDFSTAEGQAAARLCAINVIAQLKAALDGDLDRVTRCVKVTGFVNAVPGYAEHPEVINGASNLFGDVFGEAGRHARAAVGAGSLPRNVAVEVEAIFEVA
jgi:enamine deaminase RidA (YjgF/YER057c/UK114 family)